MLSSSNQKITFLCTNDRLGGAAIVTYRLMEALVEAGGDARMVVANKSTASARVARVARWRYRLAVLAERLEILIRSGFRRRDLWKVDTARFGCGVTRHPWVRDADVVVLSWVNQGLVSLADIRRLHRMGKRIVWTMHDMWCATGICHHSTGCTRFHHQCGCCPYLGAHTPADLSRAIHRRKQALYADVPVTFVAVSSWLAEVCRRSSLLRHARVEVIPNAFPVDRYLPEPTVNRHDLGLPDRGDLIVFAAARLDDPIKNLPLAVDALNRVADLCAADGRPLPTAIFCGALRYPSALDSLRIPHRHLGSITDPTRMAQIFAHATVVLSTSHRETLPGTLIDGMAAGASPVTTGIGGQADIIADGTDGYIAPDFSPDTIATLLHRALTAPFPRDAQHSAAARRFSASAVTRRFLELVEGERDIIHS